ncbi:MAG: hypothetical protein AAGE03_06185 [Pseudomonadota bacterium]
MAQPSDIEDVLSSIRRLVSSDPGSSSSATKEDRSSVAAALLLEPANRVTEPEDPFQTVQVLEETSITQDAESKEEASAEPTESDIWLGSADEIVGLAQEERDGRDAAHVMSELDTDTAAITVDLTEDQSEPLVWPAPTPTEPAPESYLEDTDYVAEIQDGDLDGSVAAVEPEDEPEIEAEAERVSAAEVTDEPPINPGPVDVVAKAQAEPVPVDYVAEIEAPVDAPPRQTDVDLADIGDVAGSNAISLDDEGFRDLIADIVRQELAGELGERITRNVRKLVRREIRQLLSSDEFD